MWALFEAESNTSRRRLFQKDYPAAFAVADWVVLSKPLKKNDNLTPEEQIDIGEIVSDLRNDGVNAFHIPEFSDLAAFVSARAEPGDLIVAMSGRNFGGIHELILQALRDRAV